MTFISTHAQDIKHSLIQYNEMQSYIKNLKMEIEDKQQLLKLTATPTVSQLSQSPGGHSVESQEEKMVIKKEQIENLLPTLLLEVTEAEQKQRRINKALDALDKVDKAIVWNRLANGYSWSMTARTALCSESNCRRKINTILERLAFMVYGPKIYKGKKIPDNAGK